MKYTYIHSSFSRKYFDLTKQRWVLKNDALLSGSGHRLSIVIKIKLGVPVAPLKVGIYFRMCDMYHIIKSSEPHVKTRAKTTSEFVATITGSWRGKIVFKNPPLVAQLMFANANH